MVKFVDKSDLNPFRFAQKTLRNLPEVLTLYYERELTVQEISKNLSMNPITVRNLLKEFGKGLRKKAITSPKLTEYDVKEIRVTFAMVQNDPKYEGQNEVIYRKLAVEYGVMPACIYKIVTRQTWQDI